jgi:tRNA nucleotidyltransferase (CCA-adding enzyme)
VRDALLRIPSKDIDITVVGDGVRLAHLLATELGTQAEVADRFGTATVPLEGGLHLDFVTARKETYPNPGALPEVEASTLEDDLARRDFTINALAVPLKRDGFGQLVDRHGGVEDIVARLVRVLHDRSLEDDPTRIFRAVKYAERLGFKIERGTLELMLQAVRDGTLSTVSTERAVRELLTILEEPRAEAMLATLDRLGVLSSIHPGLAWTYPPGHIKLTDESNLTPNQRRDAYLATIAAEYAYDPNEAEALARWLRLPSPLVRLMRDAAALAGLWPRLSNDDLRPSDVYTMLNGLDRAALEAFSRFETLRADSVGWSRFQDFVTRTRGVRTQLTGDYLRALGVKEGPVYSEAMKALHNAVLDGLVSGRAEEERFLREWLRERGLLEES